MEKHDYNISDIDKSTNISKYNTDNKDDIDALIQITTSIEYLENSRDFMFNWLWDESYIRWNGDIFEQCITTFFKIDYYSSIINPKRYQ